MRIKKTLFFLISFLISSSLCLGDIILLPAGNKKSAGRKLYQNYERGMTFQLATAVQKELKQEPNLSLFFDPHLDQKEIILKINQTTPHLLLALGAYKSDNLLPTISIYCCSYDRLKEELPLEKNENEIIFCKELPQIHYKKNNSFLKTIETELAKQTSGRFTLNPPYCLPCKRLFGYNTPSLYLEIGINNDLGWQVLVAPLARAIKAIIEKIDLQIQENK